MLAYLQPDGSVTVYEGLPAPPGTLPANDPNVTYTPVVQPTGALISTAPSASTVIPSCYYYGTATGLGTSPNDGRCPPLHWVQNKITCINSHTCYKQASQWVIDHTGAAWPVYAAQNAWENGSNGSYIANYTTNAASCPSDCVPVTEGNFGNSGIWQGKCGLTTYTYNSTTHHFGTITVQLNDSCNLTAAQHRTATCHELGHALGLNHNRSTDSCLYATIDNTLTPDADDFGELNNNNYNHND